MCGKQHPEELATLCITKAVPITLPMQELERAFTCQYAASDDPMQQTCAPWLGVPSGSDPPMWPESPVLRVQVGGGPEPPKQKERQEKHDDFYANVGDAIRTLREDVPSCLRSDLNCAALLLRT